MGKKILSIMLGAAVLLGACGDDDDDQGAAPGATEEGEREEAGADNDTAAAPQVVVPDLDPIAYDDAFCLAQDTASLSDALETPLNEPRASEVDTDFWQCTYRPVDTSTPLLITIEVIGSENEWAALVEDAVADGTSLDSAGSAVFDGKTAGAVLTLPGGQLLHVKIVGLNGELAPIDQHVAALQAVVDALA